MCVTRVTRNVKAQAASAAGPAADGPSGRRGGEADDGAGRGHQLGERGPVLQPAPALVTTSSTGKPTSRSSGSASSMTKLNVPSGQRIRSNTASRACSRATDSSTSELSPARSASAVPGPRRAARRSARQRWRGSGRRQGRRRPCAGRGPGVRRPGRRQSRPRRAGAPRRVHPRGAGAASCSSDMGALLTSVRPHRAAGRLRHVGARCAPLESSAGASAARMAGRGAGRPVISSTCRAAWCSSITAPPTTGPAQARASAVGHGS